MSKSNQAPIGAATAAVNATRLQVNEADRHLLHILDHLAAAAETIDALMARKLQVATVEQI